LELHFFRIDFWSGFGTPFLSILVPQSAKMAPKISQKTIKKSTQKHIHFCMQKITKIFKKSRF